MKRVICIFLVVLVFFISCKSVPKKTVGKVAFDQKKQTDVSRNMKEKQDAVESVEEKKSDSEVIAEFNGVSITNRDKEIAKSEIEVVVEKLNKITYQKNYSYWLKFLSSEYKREYSDRQVLLKVSKGLPGVAKGIQLRDLEDYFKYVFVPARQQVQFDDIEYLSPTKVKVIKKVKEKSLIFYNLEKIKGKWLLVP